MLTNCLLLYQVYLPFVELREKQDSSPRDPPRSWRSSIYGVSESQGRSQRLGSSSKSIDRVEELKEGSRTLTPRASFQFVQRLESPNLSAAVIVKNYRRIE